MRIFEYASLTSTNTEAARIVDDLRNGDVILACEQTAGRGQRGNSWEAEPGKNLTFSLFLTPKELNVTDSFLLSMAVSIGITEALNELLEPDIVKIKWPNDIYQGDKKLAGILIENSFRGTFVGYSIVGIGLNVNQKVFLSDAPNPVSMSAVAKREFDLHKVLEKVVHSILEKTSDIRPERLLEAYHKSLWRKEGDYQWREPDGEEFLASIENVEPTGHLTLVKKDGSKKRYIFKEVAPVL